MYYPVDLKPNAAERSTQPISWDRHAASQMEAAINVRLERTRPTNKNTPPQQYAQAEAPGTEEAPKARKLTRTDLDKLKEFKDKGDRFGYWNHLATNFDDGGYAKIALSVVTNEGLAGHTANMFMKAEAFERGVKIDSTENWKIGTDLVEADYNARAKRLENNTPDGGLRLPVRTISNYHQDVFDKHKLGSDNEAWTAGILVDPSLKEGNDAGAEAVWQDVLDNGGYKQGAYKNAKWFLCAKLGCMSEREMKWMVRVDIAGASYPVSESARNINTINGFHYDEGARTWSGSFGSQVPDGPAAQALSAERQFRIEHFGEHAIH